MSPATWPRDHKRETRMLVVDGKNERAITAGDFAREVSSADVVVVNDAATLPSLLRGTTARGEFVEARLAAHAAHAHASSSASSNSGLAFVAVLFGEGDVTMRTEDRAAPPVLAKGDRIAFGDLHARVASVDEYSPRLVTLEFEGNSAEIMRAVYRVGAPIQYAYIQKPLPLFHVTSAFASEPWAFEPASAGLTLDFRTLTDLHDKGVAIARITHAAGLSSTGDATLDQRLPFAEMSRVTREAADLIRARKQAGGRVIAIGTTVARALESAATNDSQILAPREGFTSLLLGEQHRARVVSTILTGVHVPGESHHELLAAFQSREVLTHAVASAEKYGFHTHEFGDSMLVHKAA